MIYLKYLLFTIITYLTLLGVLFNLYFNTTKNQILENNNKNIELLIQNFETQIYLPLLNNQHNQINYLFSTLQQTNKFENIKIKYLDYYISRDSILLHSDNIKTKDWVLSDISIDAKYGELEKINDTIYKFIKDEDFEMPEDIEIKFQALNDSNMQNSISRINFDLPLFEKNNKVQTKDYVKEKLIEFLHLNNMKINSKLLIDNEIEFATISYVVNQENVYNTLTKSLHHIFLIFNIIFFSLFFIQILFNLYLIRTTFIKHLKELELYTADIIINKFYRFDGKKLKQKHMVNIAKHLAKISKKMASIINELNVNKDMLELQISTDTLTKLPNTKIFEQDMKTLFLSDIPAYLISLKIECLKEYAKNNSQIHTDNLIIEFVSAFQNAITTIDSKNINSYRFYGSEFILIAKHFNYEKTNQLLELIVQNISELNQKLNISDKIVHTVAIPFDHYSTTDELITQASELYKKTIKESSTNSFYTLDSKQINEKDAKLEKVVLSIINNNAFSVSYRFDSYLFNEPDILVMQEASANLLDTEGKTVPIGTFISVAEHNNVATQFDKQLIIKVFKYIKQKKITHDIAINISISALEDPTFITWLESQILYDYKSILNNVVFSVTTFAVKNNFEVFKKFTKEIHKFKGRILLKRFSYNDLTLEELESLDLDFIRVHKDYTTNINQERIMVLKNIINFTVIHDIKVFGDIVSTQEDYEILKSLKFYATSKEDNV